MLLLLACHAPAPAPWADLAPLAPEAMRPVLRAELDDAANPTRMVTSYAQTFVLDQGRVHVLDSRYRHDPRPHCLPLDRWPVLAAYHARIKDRQTVKDAMAAEKAASK